MGLNAYQLRLPPETSSRIHDIFNVSQLCKYHSDTPLLDAREATAQPGDENDEDAQAMAPDEPDDAQDAADDAAQEKALPEEALMDEVARSQAKDPAPRSNSLFADRKVLRTLFERYCEARERLDMAQEDVDLAHDNEDVMLAPEVFAQACSELKFHPTVDLFANAQHHQVPRYMAPRSDPWASAVDALAHDWRTESRLYSNPPWSMIAQVLEKVAKDKVRMLMVIPEWRTAPWFAQWEQMCVRSVSRTDPVFLDDSGQLRKKPC